MARPEILTAAVFAAGGLVLALWLAAQKPPPTPSPPVAPAVIRTDDLSHPPPRSLPDTATTIVLPEVEVGFNGLPCGLSATVAAAAPGFARLAVSDPCRGGDTVDVTHGPIRFSARLGPASALSVDIPVISASEGYEVRLGDARFAMPPVGAAPVAEMSGVVWEAPLDLALAAYEFGAAPGTAGHVARERTGGSGRVLRFGEPGLGALTELYLGPETGGPGVVRLHVEAVPAVGDCDEPVPIVAFRSGVAGGTTTRDIRLDLSPCDAELAPILLKDLLEDVRIAGR